MERKNRLKSEPEKTTQIKNDLKETKKKIDKKSNTESFVSFLKNEKTHQVFGAFLIAFSLFSLIAFISYLFYWEHDDNIIDNSMTDIFFNKELVVKNWMSKIGALVSYIFIKKWFGIASFALIFLFFLYGIYLLFNIRLLPLFRTSRYLIIFIIWVSIFLGFILANSHYSILGGTFGGQISYWLNTLLGKVGTLLFLIFAFALIFIVEFNFSFRKLIKQKQIVEKIDTPLLKTEDINIEVENHEVKQEDEEEPFVLVLKEKNIENNDFEIIDTTQTIEVQSIEQTQHDEIQQERSIENKNEEKITFKDQFEILNLDKEKVVDEKEIELQQHYDIDTPYDPRLELSGYRFPTIDLLEDYGNPTNSNSRQEELHANKDKIIETLKNYGITIDKIMATIGPTVTLYEIIPSAGIRISKIKNLEDDIALSLSALGIRIIAPIPGKGTIGIEVPNSQPEIVPMKSVLTSEKFVNSKFDLPIAIGKTISNESFIYDLAKMPHLLMAGATGQGKSVGLNAVITSLLYKKHPAELKFIMVDPKKVELTLFSKIERHYLAKLPDSEEAIITDTKKVVRTLNSLCIEMDARYDLLKDAQCRNIKEYNAKFISRKLNPKDGHKFLPYIVLIVDEFADLIMTAGKEVEMPIARLAQLARAIGIHLIIATQRPSVNIITGTIKANFPSRLAFRVTSKIDSRTILDASGAEQLIGRGDMLLSNGNELIRLQCAFVDTPEVENITEFIGNQRGYPDAFYLPEVPDDENGDSQKDFDPNDRDPLFVEAARLIVQSQHGSTSLLQRKLKLGYNRAGRVIDQLEAFGVVGPFEGSKAREVRIKDEYSLEQFFRDNNIL